MVSTVLVADSSSWDRTAISRAQFLAWWGGFFAISTPQVTSGPTIPNSPYVAVAQQDALIAGISSTIFVKQIAVESGFNPTAVSPAGAEGIAQLMPATAASLGVNPFNPAQALATAARLMASQLAVYQGDYARALAAYNAGGATVNQAISLYGADWLPHMPAETQHYVTEVLG
jgi:Transglycosylase SLT domain